MATPRSAGIYRIGFLPSMGIRNNFGLASRESATPSVSPMMTGTCGLTLSTPWSLFEITTEAPREQSNSTRFKLYSYRS